MRLPYCRRLLHYNEVAPPQSLARYVRCFWTLTGVSEPRPERILPDGSFELVFHRTRPFRSGGTPQPAAMLMGEIRRPMLVHAPDEVDVVGVRFHAGGASAFFDFPMVEARDQLVALSPSNTNDIAAITSSLLERCRRRRGTSMVSAAIAEIRSARGDVRVADLARRLGTTERTLERAFDDIVGLSPKQLCRVQRFNASLHDDDALAYYDQSHRIHEFRELAGVTPTEFSREQHAIHDAFVGNLQS